MAKEKKEIEYSKEADDVMVAVIELFKDIKEGKDVGALASENLQNIMQAVNGADQLSAESKDRKVFLQTIGYRTGELTDAILGKSAPDATPAA